MLHWIANKEMSKLRGKPKAAFHIYRLYLGVDQLFRERNNGNVFFGFSETAPNFRPTYRYTRNQYDGNGERIYSEEKMRTPSWCDRVLWKNRPGTSISQSAYINVDSVASRLWLHISPILNLLVITVQYILPLNWELGCPCPSFLRRLR